MTFTKLYNEDSLIKLKSIKSESVDLIFTDPGYKLQLKGKLRREDTYRVSEGDE